MTLSLAWGPSGQTLAISPHRQPAQISIGINWIQACYNCKFKIFHGKHFWYTDIYICTKLDPIIVKERCGLVGPRRCISWAWLELSWAMEVAAKVKERLTFYTFTGTHVNINKNVEETSSHCLNIEETSSHYINIEEVASGMTQSQLVWSFESQGVSKILRACRNFGKVNG